MSQVKRLAMPNAQEAVEQRNCSCTDGENVKCYNRVRGLFCSFLGDKICEIKSTIQQFHSSIQDK